MASAPAFKIEKDIPVPQARAAHAKYPFKEMEIGDSFAVSLSGKREGTNQCGNPKWDTAARKLTNAAHGYAGYQRRRHQRELKFSVRTLPHEGVVRVWRVA